MNSPSIYLSIYLSLVCLVTVNPFMWRILKLIHVAVSIAGYCQNQSCIIFSFVYPMGALVLWAFLGPLGPMDVGDRWAVWGTHMGRWGTHLILGWSGIGSLLGILRQC